MIPVPNIQLPSGKLVFTYGGGVNSVAALVLLKRLGARPTAIVMSDPGSEWKRTIQYRDEVVQPWLASVGFPPVTVINRIEEGVAAGDTPRRMPAHQVATVDRLRMEEVLAEVQGRHAAVVGPTATLRAGGVAGARPLRGRPRGGARTAGGDEGTALGDRRDRGRRLRRRRLTDRPGQEAQDPRDWRATR